MLFIHSLNKEAMETTVKQRLIRYLKYKGIGQTKFEEMAGLSRGYITNLKKEPSASKLLNILNAATDLSQRWLLSGEGEMLSTDVTPLVHSELTDYATSKAGIIFKQREDGKLVMEVPVVPFSALGSMEDDYATLVSNEEIERMSFVVDEMHHGNYLCFKVEGDSMDDGTRNGFARRDYVLVRELARDKWLPKLHYSTWPYWVVVWGNNVRIKEIVAQDDQGNITLHSLNPSPEYTDFTLHLDQISKLYNVVQHVPHPNIFK